MFRFGLLLMGFASLHAALPTIKITHQPYNEFNITTASTEKDGHLLLRFSIENPEPSAFSLKMHFTNNCYLKRQNKPAKTPFPLTAVKMRFIEPYSEEAIDIWERDKSPKDCDNYFIHNFAEEDIKENYEIELLGSWGEGGYKLAPGIYGESIILTILPLQKP